MTTFLHIIIIRLTFLTGIVSVTLWETALDRHQRACLQTLVKVAFDTFHERHFRA